MGPGLRLRTPSTELTKARFKKPKIHFRQWFNVDSRPEYYIYKESKTKITWPSGTLYAIQQLSLPCGCTTKKRKRYIYIFIYIFNPPTAIARHPQGHYLSPFPTLTFFLDIILPHSSLSILSLSRIPVLVSWYRQNGMTDNFFYPISIVSLELPFLYHLYRRNWIGGIFLSVSTRFPGSHSHLFCIATLPKAQNFGIHLLSLLVPKPWFQAATYYIGWILFFYQPLVPTRWPDASPLLVRLRADLIVRDAV